MLRQALQSVVLMGGGRGRSELESAATLTAKGQRIDFEVETFLVEAAPTLRAGGNATGGDRPYGMDVDTCDSLVAETAPTLPCRSNSGGGLGTDHDQDGGLVATAYRTSGNCGAWDTGDKVDALTTGTDPNSHIVTHVLPGEGFDASEDGTGRGTAIVPVLAGTMKACSSSGGFHNSADHASAGYIVPVAFAAEPFTITERGRDGQRNLEYRQDGTANAILTPNGGRGGMGVGAIATRWAVRRLTPTECERLQGFPDGYTAIARGNKSADQCPDSPRYKALGNSMAVPVMRWIFERVNASMPKEKP